ncbi:MAG: helix-turn-helix transcriptional regulator [Caulobacterales bacterium]|nr:helix-turn-helix transcriptional regulator [Caulobacterales bacterium]MCA0372380.1 helix-turn-helix transcriptional regulator [Pseudomonadota bacterium]
MPINVTLDIMLARRKMRAKDLADRIGLSETQMSQLRNGKVRGLRFDTLSKICFILECQPSDIIEYIINPDDMKTSEE